MNLQHIKDTLVEVKQASNPGTVEDGTRVHIRYARMPGAKVTAKGKSDAERATELGLPLDAYTGRISRVWTSKAGDMILNMYVELERDHAYRSFNIDKGTIKNIVVLGD